MRACEPKVFINHRWRTVARLCFDKIHIGILLAAVECIGGREGAAGRSLVGKAQAGLQEPLAVEFEPHDIDTSHSAKAVGQLQLMTRVETCEASAAI